MRTSPIPALLLVVLVLSAGPSADAQEPARGAYGELLGGLYFPHGETLDDGSIWGARAGYRWHRLAAELSVDRFEGTVFGSHQGFDARFVAVAVSGVWTVNPGGQPELLVTGGLGRADVERAGSGTGLGGGRRSDDANFLRAGAGLSFRLAERLYVRPQGEARWFDHGNDPIDVVATVALGWRF